MAVGRELIEATRMKEQQLKISEKLNRASKDGNRELG